MYLCGPHNVWSRQQSRVGVAILFAISDHGPLASVEVTNK
jgi:hypothetical protein